MRKIYVLKDGNVNKTLTTVICLGTNDKSKFPVGADGKPLDLVANFTTPHEGKMAYITENEAEIALITHYLLNTQNPYFYDLDNPTNSPAYFRGIPEELR